MSGTPTISNLVVLVTANTSQFNAAMGKAAATTKTTTGAMGAGVSKFSGMATVAWAAAGIGAVKFVGDAIDAASDLNESLNKTRVVFEASAAGIIEWSKTTADSFGISQQAALESASTFGNLFDAMGIAEQAGAEMSTTLVELAADLASFNNASPEDVLEAMQSGLTGQIRPLRQYGIEISQAALQQEALAQGIDQSVTTMTMAQKVQLRYALILKQTGNAQGDFARTSDDLANMQRRVAAQFEDLQAQLGTALLPTVLTVVSAFNDLLTVLLAVTGAIDLQDKAVGDAALGWVDFVSKLTPPRQILGWLDNAGRALGVVGQETERAAFEFGGYVRAGGETVNVNNEVARSSAEVAAQLRDQRLAELALVDDTFALLDAQNQIHDAQRELTRLEQRGAEGTRRYDEAVANVILTQAAYETTLLELGKKMDDAGESTKDITETIRNLGEKGNLTAEQIQGIIDTLRDLDGMNVRATIQVGIERYFSNLPNNGPLIDNSPGHPGHAGGRTGPPGQPQRVTVTLDRRRFADTLDYDTTYRGW